MACGAEEVAGVMRGRQAEEVVEEGPDRSRGVHAGRIVEINSGKPLGRWAHIEPFPGEGGREDPEQPQEYPRAGGLRGWLAERGRSGSVDGGEALAGASPGLRGSGPLLL